MLLRNPMLLNPLSPNSNENKISLFIVTTCSNNQVMRIKKVIVLPDRMIIIIMTIIKIKIIIIIIITIIIIIIIII